MSALIIALGGVAALDNYRAVKQTQSQIQILEKERTRLHNQTEELKKQNTQSQQQIEQQKKTEEDLKKQIQELSAAKAERERLAALSLTQKAYAAPARAQVAVSGSCADWIAAAGIDDVQSAMTLIGRESGCNPSVVNTSSGSCGVAQELPCGKSGCVLGDGACQVRWMNSYVIGRYGSWSAALAHSYSFNWY